MIAAVIQARMSSTRLPGKTLMKVAGKPLLGHLAGRAKRIDHVESVIIATTTNPADSEILRFAASNNLPAYVGSEDDVLDRFYQTAKQYQVSTIVRVTPDCPLLDPTVAGRVVDAFVGARGELDYVSNVNPPTYPDGMDTEVFSFRALERSWKEAKKKSEREHVTPFMRNHPEIFRLANVQNEEDLSALRWTVDEPRDLQFAQAVYAHFGDAMFGMSDVLALLREHPDLSDLNRGIGRNEGYSKSLREEMAGKQMEAK